MIEATEPLLRVSLNQCRQLSGLPIFLCGRWRRAAPFAHRPGAQVCASIYRLARV